MIDGTYNPKTMTPIARDHGYFVGGYLPEITVHHTLDSSEDMAYAIEQQRAKAEYHGFLLGIWTDYEGTMYLDGVKWFESRENALGVASIQQEQAIWDCANGCEIYLS